VGVAVAIAVAGSGSGSGSGSGRPGIRVAADPVAARDFPPSISPDSIAQESGPNTSDTRALQRMQASWHRLRKRYRLSRPEMI